MLNLNLFEQINNSKSKILVVTKYRDKETTKKIYEEINKNFSSIFFGIGENRIEKILEKGFSRDIMHFIGNIQSKKIERIVKSCAYIHSLDNFNHAQLIEQFSKESGLITKVFLQVKLDNEKDSGIKIPDFSFILEQIQQLKNIEILGISGMGAGIFTFKEKEKEFETLINLRNKYLPGKLISAGTSRDYDIALKYGIEIVRIGNKIIL